MNNAILSIDDLNQNIETKKHKYRMKDNVIKQIQKHQMLMTCKNMAKGLPAKHGDKKPLHWFEGKKANDELFNSGFKSEVNQNELCYVDNERSVQKLLQDEKQ